MSVRIVRGNALALPIPDSTVDLVCTSPPYFGLRSYTDGGEHYAGQIGDEATPAEFVDALVAATAEMVRVLKPTGSIWVNLGDKYQSTAPGTHNSARDIVAAGGRGSEGGKARGVFRPDLGVRTKSLCGLPWRYALRCIDDLGLILRAEVIWSKPNGLPESVTDRVRRSHETWFHFTKEPRYYSNVDEVREAHTWTREVDPKWAAARERTAQQRSGGHRNGMSGGFTNPQNPLGKLPGSVWTVPTQPLSVPASLGVDHFAAFPMEWPRRIIRGWSPVDGTVLDPFGGTGTTALVADVLGRDAIHVDLSADYCRLARWRTTDPGQRAAAMQVEKPTPEVPGQADLFA